MFSSIPTLKSYALSYCVFGLDFWQVESSWCRQLQGQAILVPKVQSTMVLQKVKK